MGLVMVVGLYLATNLAFLHALSLQDIVTANSTAHPNAPSVAGKAVRQALGSHAAAALSILFALSALGTAHCNVLLIPRVFLAMARDGLLPASLASVSARSRTPNRAIWTFAGLAVVFAVVGTYDRLTNMTTFGYLVFFAVTTVGFLRSLRATPRAARDLVFWWATGIAILFLLGTVTLIVTSILRGTLEVVTAVVLVGSGIPIFGAIELARRRGWGGFGNARTP